MQKSRQQLVVLYQEMADLTLKDCQKSCKTKYSCCQPEHCEFTIEYAKKHWNVTLTPVNPKIPLLGPTGCIAAPHLRPICTVHTCDIANWGFKPKDQPWTDKYFALRDNISELEYEIEDAK